MIAIIDYGIGNLRSIEKAFTAVGADVLRTDRPADIVEAEKVVLPGVGAFGACVTEIRKRHGLEDAIHRVIDDGTPFLGICVGMQLLFDEGEEMGTYEGLGVIPGRVVRLDAVPVPAGSAAVRAGDAADSAPETWTESLKIPHMGWNTVQTQRPSPLLSGLDDAAYFYFVHSFVCIPDDDADVLAACRYGRDFAAIVERNNIYGVQFHPEKSQQNGLRVLQNFAERA